MAARASPYHSSVTLYENEGTGANPRSRTRPLNLKVEHNDTTPDIEDALVPDTHLPGTSEPTSSRKIRGKIGSPRKAKSIKQSLDVPHPAPERWRETYDTIKEMRSRIVAPVDTMGCDQAQLKEQDPKVRDAAMMVLHMFILCRTNGLQHWCH